MNVTIYEFLTVNNKPFNDKLFKFEQRNITLFQRNKGFIGVYPMKIRAKFTNDTPYFADTNIINFNVLHWCMRNVVRAPPLNDQQYVLGERTLIIRLPPWFQSMENDCDALIYEVKREPSQSLPKFMKFDASDNKFSIFTPMVIHEGTYEISITAIAKYYD